MSSSRVATPRPRPSRVGGFCRSLPTVQYLTTPSSRRGFTLNPQRGGDALASPTPNSLASTLCTGAPPCLLVVTHRASACPPASLPRDTFVTHARSPARAPLAVKGIYYIQGYDTESTHWAVRTATSSASRTKARARLLCQQQSVVYKRSIRCHGFSGPSAPIVRAPEHAEGAPLTCSPAPNPSRGESAPAPKPHVPKRSPRSLRDDSAPPPLPLPPRPPTRPGRSRTL
eukprot:scaffold118_cov382-Prasinococcus_capsulatus_cf.AAC.7